MTKTVYSHAEFDAVVEETFPFVLGYAGGSTPVVKPEAGKVSVQATRAAKVLYDNPLEEIA